MRFFVSAYLEVEKTEIVLYVRPVVFMARSLKVKASCRIFNKGTVYVIQSLLRRALVLCNLS